MADKLVRFRRVTRPWPAAVALAAIAASCSAPPERTATTAAALGGGGPVVWTADSMDRVGPSDPIGPSGGVQLWAARGEYESFQIIVNAPSGGLTNANVTVDDLMGPGGAVLSKAHVALFREWYVDVTSSSPNWGGSNQPLGPGLYADGLIPFADASTGKSLFGSGASVVAAPFSVTAGKNQPIWVDVFVPPGTPPGDYSGSYTVSADQGSTKGAFSLTVWRFTLPAKPALRSSFLFWNSVSQADHEELLRAKLDPLSEPASEQGALVAGFGLESVGLPFFSGADVGNCSMSAAPSVSSIQAAAAAQQSGLYLYDYSADEIGSCTNLYPTVKAWGASLHMAGVDNLVTMAPVTDLFDDGTGSGRSAVDDWTMLPVSYDGAKSGVAAALAKGDHLWSYNTLVQDAYSPKWEIDFAPMNFRIQPGFISATLSLTGILYWRVDQWTPDPWLDVNNAGTYSSSNYPGEAQLLYPGADVGTAGAAPSMRLKWLRDGVEDYDYYALLVGAGKGAWARSQIASIAPDWTNWTRSTDALFATRRALGAMLDSWSAGAAGSDGGTRDGGTKDAATPMPDGPPPSEEGGNGASPGRPEGARSSGCACVASGTRASDSGLAWIWLAFGLAVARRRA